ncbi:MULTISPECIES: hypothetical protein [Nostoc]|uniref:Uncharacterized protein n=2 Tax=Nostoc TaxID=1177 RepID=A0ABR8IKF9_9NOSO|nr:MULTISPECIES: hypothetical protein [Nostoc]MBD2565760.1 hypothetical protein [Nostoc linckia FACHB-391]MBD2651332.1 hypothetical protein [Nostoc foliaceum FACHB-393]
MQQYSSDRNYWSSEKWRVNNPDFSQTLKKAGTKTAKMYIRQVFQHL